MSTNTPSSLAIVDDAPKPLALSSQNPIAPMLEAIIQGGVTAESVAALERMTALYERMESRNAEREFNSAFVALQQDLPVIVASSIIPNRGKYERFEDVMRVVAPLLAKHGFSVSFAMDFRDGRILQTCHLRHMAGHSQANTFAVRPGGKADSDTQADCKAATTAKRNALLNALNIVIRQDAYQDEDGRDAAISGGFIDREQVMYIKDLIAQTSSDTAKLLAVAGAKSVEEITTGSFDVIRRMLEGKLKR